MQYRISNKKVKKSIILPPEISICVNETKENLKTKMRIRLSVNAKVCEGNRERSRFKEKLSWGFSFWRASPLWLLPFENLENWSLSLKDKVFRILWIQSNSVIKIDNVITNSVINSVITNSSGLAIFVRYDQGSLYPGQFVY